MKKADAMRGQGRSPLPVSTICPLYIGNFFVTSARRCNKECETFLELKSKRFFFSRIFFRETMRVVQDAMLAPQDERGSDDLAC